MRCEELLRPYACFHNISRLSQGKEGEMANAENGIDEKMEQELKKKEDKAERKQSVEDELDEALAESFPASDPVSPSAPGTSHDKNRKQD
jgi:hypothetical protein